MKLKSIEAETILEYQSDVNDSSKPTIIDSPLFVGRVLVSLAARHFGNQQDSEQEPFSSSFP
jgi:hypothetical protein